MRASLVFLLCGRRRRGGRGAHLLRVATNTLLSVSVTRCTGAAVVSVVRARRILSLLLVCWHPRGQILTLLLLPLHVTLTDDHPYAQAFVVIEAVPVGTPYINAAP